MKVDASRFPGISVYVITVRSFTDRHDHIRLLAKRFGFDYKLIFDFDADDLVQRDWERVSPALSPECASTVLKHMECQRLLVASGDDVALVVEDDVIFFDDFVDHLLNVMALAERLRPGWLIFLGGADNKVDDRFHNSEKLELILNRISTAEAYLIDRAGAIARCKWLSTNIISKPADHQLALIDDKLAIDQFMVSRALATQGSITGKFKTTLDSSRGKHSLIYLSLRYRWNVFHRRTLARLFFKFKRKFEC